MTMTVAAIENQRLAHYIDGEQVQPAGGRWLPSHDPTTGQPWYELALGDAGDVDRAVQAARAALRHPGWARITQTERANLIRRLADLVARDTERLARLDARDNGKLLREMRAQVGVLRDQFNYFAGAADKMEGATIPINRLDVLSYTSYVPLGVIGVIVPWNSPLYQLCWTLAPCLATGNTVVVKPSEHTSASALAFAELMEEAGFPPGVYNVVTGDGARTGDALTRHPGVDKIAFTGSTETGRKVAANAANHFAQCNLELGGKSPHCVFDDADLERAVNGVVAGIFAAGGQTCVAGSRILVQDAVYDEFVERLVQRAESIRMGDPLDPDTQLGPVAVRSQLEKIEGFVASGVRQGARLVTGGRRPARADLARGWYFEPTLFVDARHDMDMVREEIFGPVGAIFRFDDEQDLLRQANDTRYGLTAGVWTRDIDRALRFARDAESGTVWINTYRAASFTTPMGGTKDSGYGKHYGLESLREYARTKSVIIDYSGNTPDAFVMRVKG
jgi:aldehyde dehydrogenase (NAD+)